MKVAFDFSVYSFLGCNIKKELKNLKTAMYQEFTVASKEPIYDPLKLKLFCISSGAPRLFDAILDAMTDPSHSSVRIELNKKRTVAMLYQLCYGLSQKCNWYQCDHAVFLKDCHLNQQGLSAERLVGSTFHNPEAIDVTLLVNTVSGSSAMHKLACTYSSIMPSWIRSSFFDPELERSHLEIHTYCDSESSETSLQ